jgi:hypothetical protein
MLAELLYKCLPAVAVKQALLSMCAQGSID